jgi:FixJ family two-component response regulator
MSPRTGTVFVVDDMADIRVALARLLTSRDFSVRSFESAEHYLDEQDSAEPGCLLLDIGLPGLSGIELQRSLLDSPCARPIVFLSGTCDIRQSVNAMKSGAVDFLTKPIDSQKLFAAIEAALRCDVSQRDDRAARDTIEQRFNLLTRREQEVLLSVVAGRINKQIAWKMGIGVKTVKVHRSRLLNKMRVRSVAELVCLVRQLGIAMEPVLGPGQALAWKSPAAVELVPIGENAGHLASRRSYIRASRISI